MKKQIKIVTVAWLIGLMAAFGGWQVAAAQDVPTPSPEVTEIAPVPVQPTVEATVEPPVIVLPPAPVDNGINWADKLLEAGLTLAVIFLALKQSKLIEPDTVDKVLVRFFELVKTVTSKTDTPLDDSIVGVTEEVVRKLVQQELAKQLAGQVQAAKNSSLVG